MGAFYKPARRSKYNNIKTLVDGITFDSKAEADYYCLLKILRSNNDVQYFLRQVPFDLPGNTKYRCDFMVCHHDNRIEYIDVKGAVTATFKLKKKQVEALYPVEIVCMKQVSGYQFKVMEKI